MIFFIIMKAQGFVAIFYVTNGKSNTALYSFRIDYFNPIHFVFIQTNPLLPNKQEMQVVGMPLPF